MVWWPCSAAQRCQACPARTVGAGGVRGLAAALHAWSAALRFLPPGARRGADPGRRPPGSRAARGALPTRGRPVGGSLPPGNAGADPELRYTPQGTPVCTLIVSSQRSYKLDGERHEEVSFIEATTGGKLATLYRHRAARAGLLDRPA